MDHGELPGAENQVFAELLYSLWAPELQTPPTDPRGLDVGAVTMRHPLDPGMTTLEPEWMTARRWKANPPTDHPRE